MYKFKLSEKEIKRGDLSFMTNHLLEQLVKYFVMKRMRKWEQNHNTDLSEIDEKINELKDEKITIKEILKEIESGEIIIEIKIK